MVLFGLLLPVTVVHNGKKGLSMEEKKIYTVYPGLVCDKLLLACILDSYSIGDVVTTVLKYLDGYNSNSECAKLDYFSFNSDSECADLDYCSFNSFVYHLYLSLSHFVIIPFGGFYQLILDTVEVKEGE